MDWLLTVRMTVTVQLRGFLAVRHRQRGATSAMSRITDSPTHCTAVHWLSG